MSDLEDTNNNNNNNRRHCNSKTVFKQTFKFTKRVPEQRISPEGFLIRDCGCVMRFLPSSDNKLSKNNVKLQPKTIVKNQNLKKYGSHTNCRENSDMTKITSTEMNDDEKNIKRRTELEKFKCKNPYNDQHILYQSTFWMEPRVVPVKYTSEINFNLESPTRRFTETIDLQMKLVPCPYVQKIGVTRRFKTSIETKIQPEYTLSLANTTI